jgi:hypothetical protein
VHLAGAAAGGRLTNEQRQTNARLAEAVRREPALRGVVARQGRSNGRAVLRLTVPVGADLAAVAGALRRALAG